MQDSRAARASRTGGTASGPGSAHRVPVWAQLALVYLLTRILTTGIMLAFAGAQLQTWQTPAHPDYITFANIWDAKWYAWIGGHGYPAQLPVGDSGLVTENAWAFMPVYPFLVSALSFVTGASFELMAVLVSLAAGAGTVWLTYRLMIRYVDHGQAMTFVVLLCLGPASPLFQVGYAESLHLVMLLGLLDLLIDRRWIAMLPLVLVASLTRPTGLAWAFTLLLVILVRYRRRHVTRTQAFDRREQIEAWGAAIWSGLCGLAWLGIAAVATGRSTAYLDTEMAWRNHYTGDAHTLPFTPWFWAGDFWLGMPAGPIAVVAILLCVLVWLTSPSFRHFGVELRIWGIAYFSYLFAVFYPQSSIFRLLVPIFPAAAPLALPRSPLYRGGMSLLAIAAQVAWITWMWFVIGQDWTPP